MFKKGEKDLLCNIRRRKSWGNKKRQMATPIPQDHHLEEDQRSSSTSSSSEYTTLVDENKRLKTENGVLSSELTNMKRKCKELVDLVAKYSHMEKEEKNGGALKLFGVRLEVGAEIERKRKIDEVISESISILL